MAKDRPADRADRFFLNSTKGWSVDNSEAKGPPIFGEMHLTGLQRPVTPSVELAAITGAAPLPRSQVVSKVWDHIRKNKLQNPANKREILADDKLKKVFGSDRASMFEMNKHLSKHLS